MSQLQNFVWFHSVVGVKLYTFAKKISNILFRPILLFYIHQLRSTLRLIFLQKDTFHNFLNLFYVIFNLSVRYTLSAIWQSLLHLKQLRKTQDMGNFLQQYNENHMDRPVIKEFTLTQRLSVWFSYTAVKSHPYLRSSGDCFEHKIDYPTAEAVYRICK